MEEFKHCILAVTVTFMKWESMYTQLRKQWSYLYPPIKVKLIGPLLNKSTLTTYTSIAWTCNKQWERNFSNIVSNVSNDETLMPYGPRSINTNSTLESRHGFYLVLSSTLILSFLIFLQNSRHGQSWFDHQHLHFHICIPTCSRWTNVRGEETKPGKKEQV